MKLAIFSSYIQFYLFTGGNAGASLSRNLLTRTWKYEAISTGIRSYKLSANIPIIFQQAQRNKQYWKDH